MAKVSPVSIKYMIHANLTAEGALEKPDVIGAVFGQTEGLLGDDLEMRELQKEGKIGRIEVQLERQDKRTLGKIQVPTALDKSETTLIAAAIETIERVGPSDAQIEITRIEDVRGSKRDYILDRAKKLMQSIEGSTDSREISNEIKDSSKIAGVSKYGDEELPCGDLSGPEVIVVEGRADVLNLLRAGVKNVIAMNGTKLPNAIKGLSQEKDVTLFVDGDRGGKLIIQNVTDNTRVKYIATAPDGKEVEELTSKEILMNLRKKVKLEDYMRKNKMKPSRIRTSEESDLPKEVTKIELSDEDKKKLSELSSKLEGSSKALVLGPELEELKRSLPNTIRRMREKPSIVVMDGTVTKAIVNACEEAECQVIVASNFATTDTTIELLSL
jgi:DNA primase